MDELPEVEFKREILIIEKTKSLPKARTINENKKINEQMFPQAQYPMVDFETEYNESARPFQRIANSYENAVIPKKGDISLFSYGVSNYLEV